MEEKKLTGKESLELISQMIQNTKKNMENGGGKSLLIWGYTTIGISLLVYFSILYTQQWQYNGLWFGIPLIGYTLEYLERRSHPKMITTYIDRIISQIWLVLGVVALLASCSAFIQQISILFIIALLINTGATMTGLIIKFKALTIGGCIGILLAFSLLFISGLDSILIFAAIFLLCMVIPGHILQHAEKKNRIKNEQDV